MKRLSLVLLVVAGCSSTVTTVAPDATLIDAVTGEDLGPRDAYHTDGAMVADVSRCEPQDALPPSVDAPPDAAPYVVEIATGSQIHTCARMSDGTLRCRGINRRGAVGAPSAEYVDRPITVPGLTDVAQVVTSTLDATCTRHTDGRVRCWGSNRYHILGTGHVDDETCSDEPCRRTPTLVEGLHDVVQLATGFFAVCAVHRDGSVSCWGRQGLPEPLVDVTRPTPMPSLRDVAWMRATLSGWIVRRRDGSYLTLGIDRYALPSRAEVTPGVYNSHVCYTLPDSSVRCAGLNAHGKLGNGTAHYPRIDDAVSDPGLCGVRDVYTGAYHSCALMRAGDVWCWGDTGYGGIGVPATDDCVGIIAPGRCATRPQRVEGIDRVTALFLGVWSTWAIREDRTVWIWPGSDGTDRPTQFAW